MLTAYYKRKPEVIEAIQINPFNYVEITEWVGGIWEIQKTIGGIWEIQKTRPHVIQITVPNVFGNKKAILELWFAANVPFVNYNSLDEHIKDGTLEDYDLKQYLEYYGDYIIKKGNRFSVMTKDSFENDYDLS